jgi:Uma2 family endonuclease
LERFRHADVHLYVLCEELHLNLHTCGGTTWLSKSDLKGAEADTCFYVAEAEQVMRKDDINLEVDPPPDVVVEIDKSGQSLHKCCSIYATFRVPEIWRCDIKRRRVEIYELRGETYVEINASRSFPILTSANLISFIGQKDGQMAALAAFRQWVRRTMGGTGV